MPGFLVSVVLNLNFPKCIYGGEEFICLLPDCSVEAAFNVAEDPGHQCH